MYSDKIKNQYSKLAYKKGITILGIETSCDETAAAVVKDGREVLSNVVSSQIDIHQRFGGVVPEVASRNHTLNINGVIDKALSDAGLDLENLDAVAVTYGAGLLGALLIGVSAAKALAYAVNIPLIQVNHIEAHIAANYIQFGFLEPPFLAIVASGGHTGIVRVEGYNDFTQIGGTADDAIGEAFDKVARLLGLPYPGGPNIDRLAKEGKPVIDFYKTKKTVRQDLALSYSGLKTAVVNYIHNLKQKNEAVPVNDICASFTKTAVDLLCDTSVYAAKLYGYKTMVLAGGVAANSYLRQKLKDDGEKSGISIYFPKMELCTDNAAMVASRAYFSAVEGLNLAGLDLNAVSNLRMKLPEKLS